VDARVSKLEEARALSLSVCGCQGLLPTVSKETRVLSLYLSVDARVSKFNKAKVLSQPVRECQGQ
jgi:hypothetical protein